MVHFKYLIIGGGITADAAVQGIRKIDAEGSIGLISSEPHSPYDRPPLSKGLWNDEVTFDDIWRDTGNYGVQLILSRRATSLIPGQKKVFDHEGASYTYDKILIATGAKPRQLKNGVKSIINFRTLDDYHKLKELTETKDDFGVIGGGFIGSEIAAALVNAGKNVTMIFPEKGICQTIFPETVSEFLNEYYKERGVKILTNTLVKESKNEGEKTCLITDDETALYFDAVVAGIGVLPNIDLAKSAGLQYDNGIIVDQHLKTSKKDIYAAGDVAMFMYPALGKALRFEHEDNANSMGKVAGKNMAGENEIYDHLPMFYSDLFDIGYEAVGEINSKMYTFADWNEQFEQGIIYYLNDGHIQGIVLWGVWDKVDEARALIKARKVMKPGELKGLISFN